MNTENTFLIGQVSEITGVSQKQLRHWEEKYLPPARRIAVSKKRSMRVYTETDINLFKKIKKLLEQGFTLSAAFALTTEASYSRKEDSHE